MRWSGGGLHLPIVDFTGCADEASAAGLAALRSLHPMATPAASGLSLLVESAFYVDPRADLARRGQRTDWFGDASVSLSPAETFANHVRILRAIDAYSAFDRIAIVDHLNAGHPYASKLRELGASFTKASLQIYEHNLTSEHGFNLTCKHRDDIAKRLDDFDWFMYVEDDTLVPDETVREHVRLFQPLLDTHQRLAAWTRLVTDLRGVTRLAEITVPAPRSHLTRLSSFGLALDSNSPTDHGQLVVNPYAASWLYPRRVMRERFVGSSAWKCCYCERPEATCEAPPPFEYSDLPPEYSDPLQGANPAALPRLADGRIATSYVNAEGETLLHPWALKAVHNAYTTCPNCQGCGTTDFLRERASYGLTNQAVRHQPGDPRTTLLLDEHEQPRLQVWHLGQMGDGFAMYEYQTASQVGDFRIGPFAHLELGQLIDATAPSPTQEALLQ